MSEFGAPYGTRTIKSQSMISKKSKILYKEQGQSFGHYIVGTSVLVGRKTLKKPFPRREMAFSYTSSTCFFKQHKQQEQ